jgi:hypothetical protein
VNQREEQRVIEALRAITGGLTVTEQDIQTASGRLRSSLKPPSPRRRRTVLASAAAAAVIVAGYIAFQVMDRDENAASPATPAPSAADALEESLDADPYGPTNADFNSGAVPTARDLAGLWLIRAPYDSPLVVDGNGDWSYGTLQHPDPHGTSTLTGQTWTRRIDGRHCVGLKLPWTASIARDSSLHLEFAGTSNACTPADDREVWDKLVPGPSPVLQFLRDSSAKIDWQKPTDWSWQGLYVNPETGHVLEVANGGSYWYLDSATGQELVPSDSGELDLAAQPGTMSGTCGGGSFATSFEVGKTPSVEDYALPRDAVRIAASGDACSPGLGAAGVWVKLL